ncbi:MAG: hypothetical protein Q9220_006301 [cf. Caloplaca sp. 1 TL-2023]
MDIRQNDFLSGPSTKPIPGQGARNPTQKIPYLPNEIVLHIIRSLRKEDIKRMRRACKRFAAFGKPLLIEDLFISPREKDMEVFDGITQHPRLKNNVKRLVYDCVDFNEFNLGAYAHKLKKQLGSRFKEGRLDADGQILYDAITLLDHVCDGECSCLTRHLPLFEQSFRRYCGYQDEQLKITSARWFDRVRQGLASIGSLDSVSIVNTFLWDIDWEPRRYQGDFMHRQARRYRRIQEQGSAPDAHAPESFMSGARDSHPSPEPTDRQPASLPWNRLVGSPTARSLSPTILDPRSAMYWVNPFLPPSPRKVRKGREGLSREHGQRNRCVDCFKVVQLLRLTGKTPQQFMVEFDGKTSRSGFTGAPPPLFDSARWPTLPFLHLSQNLRTLSLHLSAIGNPENNRNGGQPSNINVLQDFFTRTSLLEHLELRLPATEALSFRTWLPAPPSTQYRFD